MVKIAGIQGLASGEQARRATDTGGGRRWEMAKLKDCQQQEMAGKLQFHFMPYMIGHANTHSQFRSLLLDGSHVGRLTVLMSFLRIL